MDEENIGPFRRTSARTRKVASKMAAALASTDNRTQAALARLEALESDNAGAEAAEINDDDDASLDDEDQDASMSSDWSDVEVKEEFIGTTKTPLSSSAIRGVAKKKPKISSIDQSICEYILLMADGITQVANAIQSTTRASQERKMFAELMTELSSIPGFSEEEVDTIYDNLSKNPIMIQSFLARPMDSKVRWMHKELGK